MADGDNVGRVLIAFDDGPLEPSPTWTRIDNVSISTDGCNVASVEITAGKQDEFDESETNHATVRIHDTGGVFDPSNPSSPYAGKLQGKQILLQLYNPVTATWHERFRGTIDEWVHDIHEATVAGVSILSNVSITCVGLFDYLAGIELIPGVHGDTPPAGYEDIVFYENGEVDDCLIALLTDAGVDSTRMVIFSGNVLRQEGKWDAGESLLVALRDTADAETPVAVGNIYEDRHGRLCFHGRQSILDPATVAAGAGSSAWDYQVHKIGDGAAIAADSDYAQIRPPFTFKVARNRIVNAALIIPRGINRTNIPSLVESDATSITAYGTHSYTYPDSLNGGHKTNGDTAAEDCQRSADFLVSNYKDPLIRIDALTVKAIRPTDARASKTWAVLAKADIADMVTLDVGYPGGVGVGGNYFIQGWTQKITRLNQDHDMVELGLNVSPQPTVDTYND